VVRIHGGEPVHPTFTVGCLYTYSMPNSPKTPTRTIRVSDQLWTAVQKKAAAEKVTVTSIIIEALEDYIKVDN
jgi:predicted HicB family RNase H-like nuclease